MKEITVIAKNELGSLAAVAEALGNTGVNIEAISAYEKDHQAIFRVITNDVVTANKALSKIPNVTIREADIVIVKMSNRPGELGKLTRKLANKSVNLEGVYIVSRHNDFTEVAVKPASDSDFEKVKEVLGLK
ncbi:MAG: hypothetical protein Q7S22_08145 [Candidatus Micrarchaeota archaeon]|nr:hypothetical protein [Candidatus Micrarchaeota archaeon]